MALQRLQFLTVIFFLLFSVFFVPGPINVMSDSATTFKPTTRGVINTATDPPWMSRPGREINFERYHRVLPPTKNNEPSNKATITSYSIKLEHNLGWSLGKKKVAGQMEPHFVTMREHREVTTRPYIDIRSIPTFCRIFSTPIVCGKMKWTQWVYPRYILLSKYRI